MSAALKPAAASARADASPASAAALGMWVFVASEALFFGVLLFTYGVARWHAPAAFAAASAKTDLWAGTTNTAVLLTSSAWVALASERLHQGAARDASRWLAGAALLGVVFLGLKGLEWHSEWTQGLFPGTGWTLDGRAAPAAELFFAWYLVATGLHAVHLAIGIAIALFFAERLGRVRDPAAERERVHAFGLYWHFVDVVWIVLYPLIYLVAPRT
jgi:cytochrome c oxidase subunit 3